MESSIRPPLAPSGWPRSGRVALVLALLLLGGLCLIAILFVRTGGVRGEPAAPVPAGAEAPSPEPPPIAPRVNLGLGTQSPASGERPPIEARPTLPAAERFRGKGRIDGFLDVPPGMAVPRPWTLVLEPSDVLIGGEHAEGRRLVFEAGETEFTLEDVPLGGYVLRAEAPRMSGVPELLLLARPDAQNVIVRLALRPAAFVEGIVQREDGTPIADLPLHLHPLHGGEQLATRSDARGAYLFDSVQDGEYRLFAGHAMSPVVPALDLAVTPPSLHVPPITVPPLGALVALVVDADGLAVPDARVEGWGSHGGRVEAQTDLFGEARAQFLPAGRYTLRAWAGEGAMKRSGRATIELVAGGEQRLRIQLGP